MLALASYRLPPRAARRGILGSQRERGACTLAAIVLLLATVACGSDPAKKEVEDSRARRAALRQQLEAAQAELAPWQPWYRRLEEVSGRRGVGPGMLRTDDGERAMVEPRFTRLRAERGKAGDSGPIGPFETLVDVAAQLRQLGIDFLVMPVPPTSAVYPRRMVEGAPPDGEIPPFLDWRLRTFYLALEEEGIEVVDLLPAFLDPPPPPPMPGIEAPPRPAAAPGGLPTSSLELLFRLQDRHWTPLGAQVAAGVLAARIRRFPWFDEAGQAMGRGVIVDSWALEHERGPIAEGLVRSGALAADYPDETFLRRRTQIEGELWSFEDPGSPILLLGDSFASRHYGFRDALLAELGFRIDAITLPGGRPSSQLQALRLRSSGSGHPLAGKRLVVWQFSAAAFAHWHRWRPIPLGPGDGSRQQGLRGEPQPGK
ncbi:MAG: hypothetical protein MI919_07765 [Holophagales bacterium]|nr:hypothetical protein [Holophagales bacterium]